MDGDPFWKRSAFGALVLYLGSILIYWAVDGVEPTAQEFIQALVLMMAVFGYVQNRPSVSTKKVDEENRHINAILDAQRQEIKLLKGEAPCG